MDSHRNSLKPGYQLHWYQIKKILGQGGFGITYLAQDTNLNQLVAIKEFLPTDMAVREDDASIHPVSGEYGDQFKWGLDRFMSEAQTLARFKHPNIVRVMTVFPENNTAYMVMEYEQGRGMHELLTDKRTLGEAQALAIVLPVLDGLAQVHEAGFIHRDIKPPNLFIREDGSPVLLDFGSARQSFGQQTHTLTTLVSPGFAPFEQYVAKSDKQGPWTDIYGLGATLYRAVIGRSPSDAMNRSEALLHTSSDIYVPITEINPSGYSPAFLSAIDHALAFKPEDRPQNISDWIGELKGERQTSLIQPGIVMGHSSDPGSADTTSPVFDPSTPPATGVNLDTFGTPLPEYQAATVLAEAPRKQSSWFRRLLKYTTIVFVVLLVLAILGGRQETVQESVIDESRPVSPVRTQAGAGAGAGAGDPQDHIHTLLEQAEDDIAAWRLTSPLDNNAMQKYRAVLAMEADNADALQGIQTIADKYLQLAVQRLEQGDVDKATRYLSKSRSINPDHPHIPRLEAAIADSLSRQQAIPPGIPAVTPLIDSADQQKIRRLQNILKNNPNNIEARKELQKLLKGVETKVKQSIAAGDLDTAEAYLQQALELAPTARKIKQALQKIRSRKQQNQ